MGMKASSEILLNATLVTADNQAQVYEFILNSHLSAIECVRVESLTNGIIFPLPDFKEALKATLFELNHVRVNPKLNNQDIIETLTEALEDIGVEISNTPKQDSMAICYRPLGELSENVRFFCESDGKIVFLAPTRHLKVIPAHDHKGPPSNVIKF
jgi:hypothetical protein